ncbi:MAG: hypothetical protein UT66_C0050G0010 [candidate division CPR2 bacterium GW2011_GWC1_39_9]|uniref:ABC-type antimicrobial peptide transport system, permease component n=1 Tax=candidate division CPR2 bacterium GW2011_GWC2_39_10 TaxID=1618345 RepID=A0A0G0LNC9_UNCC2|nr:MAG: ABC-type antimicrobial peptide transport system, permease component [candidate division CPR2 bacterium GW2011_GWC2_39_10]KKR32935.1 MAG: hypothetical protein UT66_C0050G0010 [candidate division CPR2 bacterium GW2011_GWC1_39_9]
MLRESIKIAITNIWAAKMRSFLTMLGVIIGVSSVVVLVSIGDGAKRAVEKQVGSLGANLLIIQPGRIEAGKSINVASTISSSVLNVKDLEDVKNTEHVTSVSPMMMVGGVPASGNNNYPNALVVAGYPEFKEMLNFGIENGNFFNKDEYNRAVNEVIIGENVKKQLFGDGDAIGKKITVLSNNFIVKGTIKSKGSNSGFGPLNFDDLVVMPFSTASKITGHEQVWRIFFQVDSHDNLDSVKKTVTQTLTKNHDGIQDFTVLAQDDLVGVAGTILNVLTALIASIAGISLVVGGIGIMNMMLVTVTERTKEIGIRKAIGATKKDILLQFLIEAMVISFVGAMLGFALGMFGQFIITKLTSAIEPYLSLQTVYSVIAMAFGVGVVFGLLPAIKAANKNPIEALRWE